MKLLHSKCLAVAGFLALLQNTTALGLAATAPAVPCESLAKLTLPDATITVAQPIAAGDLRLPAGPPPGGQAGPAAVAGRSQQAPPAGGSAGQAAPGGSAGAPVVADGRRPRTDLSSLPAICRVQAAVRPSSENDITLELWLPAWVWNGSLVAMTHPSAAGGNVNVDIVDGVRRGFAALLNVSPAFDSWDLAAKSADLLQDFGHRSLHAMVVAAKGISSAFYGAPVEHAYFMGCSEGGREGFNAAHHHPEDFDGIIVGGSGVQFSIINAAQLYPAWFMSKDGARFIPESKWVMVHNAVLDTCDALDGVMDRVVQDPRQCLFDPASLLCEGTEADNCLTAPQIEALKATYKGPVNPRTGEVIFPGPVVGGELPVFEFANPDAPMRPAERLYKHLVLRDPDWDFTTMDYDKDVSSAIEKLAPVIETGPADLKAFIDRGGRLVYWDGFNDYNNPYYWMDYQAELERLFGAERVAKSVRMFFLPGVQHCAGGEGCDTFDKLGTIAEWVNTGKPPERIITSRRENGTATRTCLVCRYPQVARFKGPGDTSDAASFVCEDANPGYK